MNKYINAVEKNEKLILESHKYIWNNPETGYKEYKTRVKYRLIPFIW